MSTSLLYHAWGLQGYRYRRTDYREGGIGKGHRYLTVVLDLDYGAVVFIGQGNGAEALQPFWKKLHGSGARIEAVTSDMSPSSSCTMTNSRSCVVRFNSVPPWSTSV